MTVRTPDQWADAVRTEAAGLEGASTLTGTVQVDVTGGPDGDLAVHATFDGGRLAGVDAVAADQPAATVTLTAEDGRAVCAGELDPSVAFMQGRLKVTGDMGLVLDLLALSATAAARACRERLAAAAPA